MTSKTKYLVQIRAVLQSISSICDQHNYRPLTEDSVDEIIIEINRHVKEMESIALHMRKDEQWGTR